MIREEDGQTGYGELFEVNETGTAIAITTGGSPSGTFYPWVTATPGNVDGFYVTASGSYLVIGEAGTGVYDVRVHVSHNGVQEREYQMAVHVNGRRLDHIRADQWFKTEGNDNTTAFGGLVRLLPGDAVGLRFSCSASGTSITVKHVNLSIRRL